MVAEVLPALNSDIEILTERFNRHYAMCGICQKDGDVCYDGAKLLRRFNAELAEVLAQ